MRKLLWNSDRDLWRRRFQRHSGGELKQDGRRAWSAIHPDHPRRNATCARNRHVISRPGRPPWEFATGPHRHQRRCSITFPLRENSCVWYQTTHQPIPNRYRYRWRMRRRNRTGASLLTSNMMTDRTAGIQRHTLHILWCQATNTRTQGPK